MQFEKRLLKVISLAEKECTSGGEVLSQRVFDEAAKILKDEDLISVATKTLDIDAEAYFANTLLALGAEKGLWTRIRLESQKRQPEGLSQTVAYPLVDLWGRLTGIEALIFDLAESLDLARKDGCSPALLKPRMAAVYDLLEMALQSEIQELSKLADLAVLGDSLDRLMTMLRSERQGLLGKALDRHVNLLPA